MIFLNPDAIIPEAKLTRYLLIHLSKDDKSKFLAKAGYTLDNWQELAEDIKSQLLSFPAFATEQTEFGQKYEIQGVLTGRNGVELSVTTVWIVIQGETRFVTLVPRQ